MRRRAMPYELVRWVDSENVKINDVNLTSDTKMGPGFKGNDLLLFHLRVVHKLGIAEERGPGLREFNRD